MLPVILTILNKEDLAFIQSLRDTSKGKDTSVSIALSRAIFARLELTFLPTEDKEPHVYFAKEFNPFILRYLGYINETCILNIDEILSICSGLYMSIHNSLYNRQVLNMLGEREDAILDYFKLKENFSTDFFATLKAEKDKINSMQYKFVSILNSIEDNDKES